MRRVAITNQKGGSCKTTTAVNLAAALGEKGWHVLLIDLDQQRHASKWLGHEDADRLAQVFLGNGNLADVVIHTDVVGVDLVPGSPQMAGMDRALAGELGAEVILRRQLDKLPANWDVVLMDCPPAIGIVTVNAFLAADELLVPVEIGPMALDGLAELIKTVDKARERLHPALWIGAIVPCRVDRRTNISAEVVAELRAKLPRETLKAEVRENVRLKEAFSHRRPILSYAPASAGTEDYRAVAAELARRWTKAERKM